MEEWPNRDQLAEPERDSSPIFSVSLLTFPYPLSCKKSRTRAQQQHPLDPRIKDPVAVGVSVALKETPLLFEFFPAHLSLSTFLQKA
jgi:hypothetical protein